MNELNRQIKSKVENSVWRAPPYGSSPHNTLREIICDSFEGVKKLSRSATRCRLEEMYNPEIGELRKSKSYSALAPGNGMKYQDRRVLPGDLRPFKAYKTKQSEWMLAKEKPNSLNRTHGRPIPDHTLPPLPPTSRRQYAVPANATRFENFAVYWGSRAKGLDYSGPFVHEPHRDTYDIHEDRRYHRLYWSQFFIPNQPTARHGRQILLTAY